MNESNLKKRNLNPIQDGGKKATHQFSPFNVHKRGK